MTQQPNRAERRRQERVQATYDPLATRSSGRSWFLILAVLILLGVAAFALWELLKDDGEIPVYGYEVVNTFPHDEKAFTQGLLFHEGFLYESTGREGESSVRKVELETGKVLERNDLPQDYFGEGLARVGNELVQVTWRNGRARYYDLEDKLALKRIVQYAGEGWGLAYDGEHLLFSDGTNVIHFVDPQTFKEVRHIRVQSTIWPISKLNELEYIDGEIWANVWHQERIARIDPQTGRIRSWVDLSGLYTHPEDKEGVLNGIAHDPATGRLFVTGKLWPHIYEIRLVDPK